MPPPRGAPSHLTYQKVVALLRPVPDQGTHLLVGPGGTTLRAFGYLVIVGGALAWAERAARTVPRHAKLASRVGLGGSLVVGLTAVLPWLDLSAQSRPNTPAMAIVGAAAIALPSWIAAGDIATTRR